MYKNIRVVTVVAVDSKRGIGKDNKLLFRIKEDFVRMRNLIKNKPLIMGRKTFESMLTYTDDKLIPGSTNIVVTHEQDYQKEGAVVVHSIDEGLEIAAKENPEEIVIFGGAKIYEQSMDLIDRLYLTVVEGDFKADTFLPDYSDFKKVLFEEDHQTDKFKFKFLDLER